ncbi:MAG: GatB/YqeY domain-containing protein [Candidatus Kerfeldbacteria bacterium]|jgi:uncharacterized protein
MSLQNKIEQDIRQAMTQKNELEVSVLRMVKSALQNKSIELKKKELGDDEVLSVLSNQAKRRKEAADSFAKGGREEMAQKEKDELKIIEKYLPEQMSEDDVKKIVLEIIDKMGDNKNFGAVMGQTMAKLNGQADGKLVTQIVKDELG